MQAEETAQLFQQKLERQTMRTTSESALKEEMTLVARNLMKQLDDSRQEIKDFKRSVE